MGAALKTGFARTDADLIITMDSDLTFRPEDIPVLLTAYAHDRPECVSGSPYLEAGLMEEVTPMRLFFSKSVNFMYRILLRQPITCVSPIFRLYRTDTLKKLDLESEKFEINAEIISEVPHLRLQGGRGPGRACISGNALSRRSTSAGRSSTT